MLAPCARANTSLAVGRPLALPGIAGLVLKNGPDLDTTEDKRIGAWLGVVKTRDATCRTMQEAWF